jgi:lipopolysaccharide transport system ATP-binding protein
MSLIIQVKDLSKSFILAHEEKERYTALRDVVSKKAKKIFSFPFSFSSRSHTTKEEFWALKDINFHIQAGDRVGIIGRNGAGKSTLLKILSRITEPTRGEIKIKGRVASLLEVGTGFHPELSGKENIFLNGAILGMTRNEIKKKFDEIVDFAEVENFLDTPVKRYSSGMYVRLAFAVAAHLEPEILVVDEVLAVGDAQFQRKCLGKMEEVSNKSGRTVLFVSHQMDAIETLTNQCIYLKNGQVQDMGGTSDVTHHYLKDNQEISDVKAYTNRSGSGKARVIKLELRQAGNPVSMVRQGDSFDVIVGIENRSGDILDISFVLENYKEQALFCTQLSDTRQPEKDNGYIEKVITVNVPHLRKGDYLMSMAVFRSDKTEFHDIVLHFPLLAVDGIAGDLYFPQDSRWGDLFFNLQWK